MKKIFLTTLIVTLVFASGWCMPATTAVEKPKSTENYPMSNDKTFDHGDFQKNKIWDNDDFDKSKKGKKSPF